MVVTTFWDDQVRPALARLDVLDVHRPDGRVVLVAHGLERAAALLDIAAASLCATVVLPEPVPPAIPTTSGRSIAAVYYGTADGIIPMMNGLSDPLMCTSVLSRSTERTPVRLASAS